MPTYKLRFKFHVSHKGMLKGEEKEFDFTLPNGHKATLHCFDAENFNKCTTFIIISCGYCSEHEAVVSATELKEAVLFFGAKFRMGVDTGKDKASGYLAESIKDKIFEDHGVKIITDVHGISVYSEEHPTSCMSMSAVGLVNPKDNSFFAEEVCNIISAPKKIDDKTRLSMELLTSSYFELSPRSRFLTLVLAAESILNPDKRSEDVKFVVDELKNYTKSAGISDEEKCSILGTLNWLYKDSISQSLKKMANQYLVDKQYNGLSAENFIKKCYDARSKLVHTGRVNESKFNIGILAANLEVYMTDMLTILARL